MMDQYQNGHYTGERALYHIHDAEITDSLFDDGESPLKECSDLKLKNVTFGWKYPLWYGKNILVEDSTFLEMSRSGLWYTDDSIFRSSHIIAPKEFRRCHNITLEDLVFDNAQETLWTCDGVKMKNIKAKGDYFGKDSRNIQIDHFELDGNYCFDGGENIEITNSILHSKDSFWNCRHVRIKDCVIEDEYFAWNSEDIVLENCIIRSHQGFCYMKDVKLIHCQIEDSDLIFEFCENLQADVCSPLDSVKNPISGHIRAESIKELVRDEALIDPKKTIIEVKDERGNYHEV